MISLEDLKNIMFRPKKMEYSNLEYVLLHWFENKEFLHKDLSSDEIVYGLSHYLDSDTFNFWTDLLSERTISYYIILGSNIPLVNDILNNALIKLDDQKAILNYTENKIVFESTFAGQLIKYNQCSFLLDENLQNIIDFESYKLSFPVIVSIKNNCLIKSISMIQDVEDYFLTSLNIVKNSIAISLVIMSLNSIIAEANEKDSMLMDAIKHSTKAFSKTDTGKKVIHETIKEGKKEVKEFKEDNPNAEVPVAVLGFGLKTIKDKGVKLKNKNDMLLENTTYEVLVGKELEVSMSGKNPIAEKSKYKLSATPEKIQMNLSFDVDW